MSGTWIGIVVALLGGGAMGALIKVFYDLRRDRIQSISRGVRIFSLFRHDRQYEDFGATLSVSHNGSVTEFRTLYVADVVINNRSTHDYAQFDFGLSLAADAKCVHVGWENPDQHHVLELIDIVSPSEPQAALRFRLAPFNRRDVYSLRLYLVPGENEDQPAIARFTSSHPVKFVDDSSLRGEATSMQDWSVLASIVTLLLALETGVLVYSVYRLHHEVNDFNEQIRELKPGEIELNRGAQPKHSSGREPR
jgi:hypothetical protein